MKSFRDLSLILTQSLGRSSLAFFLHHPGEENEGSG